MRPRAMPVNGTPSALHEAPRDRAVRSSLPPPLPPSPPRRRITCASPRTRSLGDRAAVLVRGIAPGRILKRSENPPVAMSGMSPLWRPAVHRVRASPSPCALSWTNRCR